MTTIGELDRSELSEALGFVLRLAEARSRDGLRSTVIGSLRTLVPADSVTFTEIETSTGRVRWWTDPPEVGEAGDNEAFVAHLHQHPIAAYHATVSGSEAVQFADFLTERELHALALYNDFYRPLGVEHQLAIAIEAPGGLSIPISVQRGDRGFDLHARAMLELLHPYLENAYQRVDVEARAAALLESLASARTAGIVIVDRDDRIEYATASGRRWLDSYFAPAAAASLLPEAIAERLPGWRASADYETVGTAGAPRLLVDRPQGRLSVRYVRTGATETLLLEEQHRGLEAEELRELGLTPREAELLSAAAGGGTIAELAEALVISPLTVKKHLENIYRKLGVGSRTEAIAAAMNGAPEG